MDIKFKFTLILAVVLVMIVGVAFASAASAQEAPAQKSASAPAMAETPKEREVEVRQSGARETVRMWKVKGLGNELFATKTAAIIAAQAAGQRIIHLTTITVVIKRDK